jgi:chromosome condensin MukBEF complex kleisin-like MukF subunit
MQAHLSKPQHESETMSYSFQVKAPTKASAKEAVAAKFDEIVAQQPIHARDRDAVLANANTVVDLLADNDSKDVIVSCNGYVSWPSGTVEEAQLNAAAVSASAGYADRA